MYIAAPQVSHSAQSSIVLQYIPKLKISVLTTDFFLFTRNYATFPISLNQRRPLDFTQNKAFCEHRGALEFFGTMRPIEDVWF